MSVSILVADQRASEQALTENPHPPGDKGRNAGEARSITYAEITRQLRQGTNYHA